MWTELRWLMPLTSAVSVSIGPTSQVKKAGVMQAFSSAPHLEYGKTFLNHFGTLGKPLTTTSLCSLADLPCDVVMCTVCLQMLSNTLLLQVLVIQGIVTK